MKTESQITTYFAKLNATLSENATLLMADILSTPIGEMLAVWSDVGLCLLEFIGQKHLDKALHHLVNEKSAQIHWCDEHTIFQSVHLQHQLNAYFSGSLKQFSVPLDFVGTDFQQRVWFALCQIPYAETISYQEQAKIIGNPRAVRAVAAANSQNKISIIVPCHRVIGSNGKLTGYAGGLPRKQFLLDLEQKNTQYHVSIQTHS